MWVLFLAIASFLAYIGILALLCLADRLETRTRARRTMFLLSRTEPFSTLNVTQAFEPIYAVLWEAPVLALHCLSSAGPKGLAASQLHPIFRKAAARFPEIYDGYTFQQWLQFLEKSELIRWDGGQVALTCKGREFLAFRFTWEAFTQV
jgi:hypothetical protein